MNTLTNTLFKIASAIEDRINIHGDTSGKLRRLYIRLGESAAAWDTLTREVSNARVAQ